MTDDARQYELAILSAVVLDPRQMDAVAGVVAGRHFLDRDLGQLWDALCVLYGDEMPIGDPRVTLPALRSLGVPSGVRTVSFWAELSDAGVASNARYYAEQIARRAKLARLQAVAAGITQRISDPMADPAAVADWADSQISGFASRDDAKIEPIEAPSDRWIESQRHVEDATGPACLFGIESVDEWLGGMRAGELWTLAARTGIGKSAFAAQVAKHNAMRMRGVLLVSLEMTGEELAGRVLCGSAGVNGQSARVRNLTGAELTEVQAARDMLAGAPFRLWAPPAAKLSRIRAAARHTAALIDLRLVIVDYVQLVQPADPRRPRHEQIGEISMGLKTLAKELGVAVLSLAQLNRQAEGEKPKLSHLRESGSLEQDSDAVIFLHRDREGEATELMVPKHRHGRSGKKDIRWRPERTEFSDLEVREMANFEPELEAW